MEKEHEHLAHSLILDVNDKEWCNYFSPAEIKEIASHHSVELPATSELDSYLNELKPLPPQDLYTKLVSEELPIDSINKWIQDSFYQSLRLYRSGFFPIHEDVTEGGLEKRVWSCIDSCFDFSGVDCLSGEKCSQSSANAMNACRTTLLSRQATGRKMDYLFRKAGKVEVGCGECGLVRGTNTTKELYDSMFKMPKVMKEMMINLVSSSPSLKSELVVVGYFIGEDKLKLQVLDCPSAYVTRYSAYNPVYYPDSGDHLYRKLSAVLKVIYAGRLLMENTAQRLENDTTEITIGREEDETMTPCFIPAYSNKRRKR